MSILAQGIIAVVVAVLAWWLLTDEDSLGNGEYL